MSPPITRAEAGAIFAVSGVILAVAASIYSWLGIPALVRKALIEDPVLKQSIESIKVDAQRVRQLEAEATVSSRTIAEARAEAMRAVQSLKDDAKQLAEEREQFRPLRVEQGECGAEVGGPLSKTDGTDANDFKPVAFSARFNRPPTVLVALSTFEFDDAMKVAPRLQIAAVDVTAEGFKCRFSAWSLSRVRIANATWIAIGQQTR